MIACEAVCSSVCHKHDLLPIPPLITASLHWEGQAAYYSIFMNKANVFWWAGLISYLFLFFFSKETAWWTWTFPLSWFSGTALSVKSFLTRVKPTEGKDFAIYRRGVQGEVGKQKNKTKKEQTKKKKSRICCFIVVWKKEKLSTLTYGGDHKEVSSSPPALCGLRDEAQLRANEWKKIRLYQICSKRV